MEIIDKIIPKGREQYKCYDLIKNLLKNKKFYNILELGFNSGNILPFNEELLQEFNKLNIRWPVKDIDEVLYLGGNIGGCTTMAYQLSFLFDDCYKCAGFLPILKGTKNSCDGRHTWMESSNGWIYDTSLMLIINKTYSKMIGYQENIREKYDDLQFYSEQKEFALDKSFRINR